MTSLIYIGDPMCSWCYGFAPEVSLLKAHYKDKLNFSIITGGLRAGGGEEWNQSFKDFLKEHWQDVSKRSGQPFQYNLLDLEYFDYDTEPACRAVCVVRDIAPEQEFDFFKATQYHFYFHNKDPKQVDFYKPICQELNIHFPTFQKHFASSTYKQKAMADFTQAQQIGVRSFPTLVLQHNNQLYPISLGYSTFQEMKDRVETHL